MPLVRVPSTNRTHFIHITQEIYPKNVCRFSTQIEIVCILPQCTEMAIFMVGELCFSHSHSTSSFQFQFTTFQARIFKTNQTQKHTHTNKMNGKNERKKKEIRHLINVSKCALCLVKHYELRSQIYHFLFGHRVRA